MKSDELLKQQPHLPAVGHEIPEHWNVVKLRGILRKTHERNHPDWPLLSVAREQGVILRNVEDQEENHNFIPDDLSNYKVVRKGQFAMNKMKAWQGSYGISPLDGIVSPAYFVFDMNGVKGDFFNRAIRSRAYVPYFNRASDGVRIGQWDLSPEQMREIPFLVPPLQEQAAIARFLDHADEQIQHYIASKERLIALLEEERQAVIHQAVTRGLDPNVKLKPSGVEWLGDVPEHWSIRTLGQIADSFRTGPFGSMLHQSDYIEGGIPVINPIHIRGGVIAEDPSCSVSDPVAVRLSDYRLAKHDLVFSRRGELGRCSLVRDRETNWLCGTGSIRVRITYDGIDPEFVIQALQVQWVGEYLSHVSVGATMNNLNTGILKSIPILMPPLQEQGNILGHSTRQTSAIDAAIARARQQIELVEEYRTRLIADVVTGQLDVREAAEELPRPEPTEITD